MTQTNKGDVLVKTWVQATGDEIELSSRCASTGGFSQLFDIV